MIKNYLLIALRNIKKQKVLSFINIFGLALGMVASIYMLIYVIDEFSYESSYDNADRICRIGLLWGKGNENIMKFVGIMPAVVPAIKENYPDVKASTRVRVFGGKKVKVDDKEFTEENIFYVDEDFRKVFSISFLQGKSDKALTEPNTVLLTKNIAEKYFGKQNPIGKTIELQDDSYKVTGVIENSPDMTHLKYNMLISYSTINTNANNLDKSWQSWGMDLSYLLLKENASKEILTKKLNGILKSNTNEWFVENVKFVIQNLDEIHWVSDFRSDIGPKGNKMYAIIFLVASILVLSIACFNFINLSVAQFMERIKEVGVRKVIGASRKELTVQFIVESLLLTLLSFLISIILFEFIKSLDFSFMNTASENKENYFKLIGVITFMIILVATLGGLYPAFYFGRVKPIEIIKNKSIKISRNFSFRKVLVVVQFVVSLLLISGTLIIFKQMNFTMNSDLGYTKENALIINLSNQEIINKYDLFRKELNNNKNIKAVTGAFTLPGVNSRENMGIKVDGNDESVNIQTVSVDVDFIKAMDLELKEGREFSLKHSTDLTNAVILNEAAVKALNLKSPISKKIEIPENKKWKKMNVVGVVKDFHLQSMHQEIPPLMFYINPERFMSLLLRFNENTESETIKYVEATWDKLFPYQKINYTLLSDSYEALYKTDNNTKNLLFVFAILSIIISSLGLLGLTLLSVKKRIKEIGIRKVLGATILSILLLISKDYLIMVVLSIAISVPIVYYLMNEWLQTFVYRTNIDLWIFVLSGSIALLLTFITVSSISIKSALTNPVNSLKDE